jgi:hypothetical protein
MAMLPLELYIPPFPPPPPRHVPGGRHQPQHENVQVKFPLHAITSYNGNGLTCYFVLDIGALWRCVVSLMPGSFALSPLEERSTGTHWIKQQQSRFLILAD